MANPTLTNILFAGLLVTFIAATLITNYADFAVMNNATIEEPYRSVFYNISNEYSDFSTIGGTVKEEGLVTNILNLGGDAISGTINVFVTGLQAIGTFFDMIPVIGDILSAIGIGIPQLSGLIGMLILMVGIYMAMRYIQSASNKTELP